MFGQEGNSWGRSTGKRRREGGAGKAWVVREEKGGMRRMKGARCVGAKGEIEG